ncbi:hypothetical protein QQF64_009605 [Cirrhinus molitorella]|uniref:Uncharacterized protein n=1 Tax=Cirrhinus molitorella TaxID=172907 RepID=A0ABR3M1M7_9TELE
MPRKKGVSLKRSCPQRSEPDAIDVLNEEQSAATQQIHPGPHCKDNDNDISVVEVANPEAERDDENSSLAEKDKLMFMAQTIKALEKEQDFLRQTVLKLSNRGSKKEVKKILDTSTDCSTSNTDVDSLTSSSSSESPDSDIPQKKRRAVVAEIQLVDPEFYRSIPKFRAKEEKLFDFAKRCLQSLTADVREKVFQPIRAGLPFDCSESQIHCYWLKSYQLHRMTDGPFLSTTQYGSG